jgi:hypothetical protein
MNERIREIAKQAREYADATDAARIDESYASVYQQKFAELVINASVKFLKENDCDFEAEQLEDFWRQG